MNLPALSRVSKNIIKPFVIPAEAGIQTLSLRKQGTIQMKWIPHPPIVVEGRQVRNDIRQFYKNDSIQIQKGDRRR
jgi:hypothetical protein